MGEQNETLWGHLWEDKARVSLKIFEKVSGLSSSKTERPAFRRWRVTRGRALPIGPDRPRGVLRPGPTGSGRVAADVLSKYQQTRPTLDGVSGKGEVSAPPVPIARPSRSVRTGQGKSGARASPGSNHTRPRPPSVPRCGTSFAPRRPPRSRRVDGAGDVGTRSRAARVAWRQSRDSDGPRQRGRREGDFATKRGREVLSAIGRRPVERLNSVGLV